MKIFKGLLLGTLIQFSNGQNITVSTRKNLGFNEYDRTYPRSWARTGTTKDGRVKRHNSSSKGSADKMIVR